MACLFAGAGTREGKSGNERTTVREHFTIGWSQTNFHLHWKVGSCHGKCQSALGQGSLPSFICIAVRGEAGMVLNGC